MLSPENNTKVKDIIEKSDARAMYIAISTSEGKIKFTDFSLALIQSLKNKGALINAIFEASVFIGCHESVSKLLKEFSDIIQPNGSGFLDYRPIITALSNGYPKIAELLVKHPKINVSFSDFNPPNPSNTNPSNTNPSNTNTSNTNTSFNYCIPLIFAVQRGYIGVINALGEKHLEKIQNNTVVCSAMYSAIVNQVSENKVGTGFAPLETYLKYIPTKEVQSSLGMLKMISCSSLMKAMQNEEVVLRLYDVLGDKGVKFAWHQFSQNILECSRIKHSTITNSLVKWGEKNKYNIKVPNYIMQYIAQYLQPTKHSIEPQDNQKNILQQQPVAYSMQRRTAFNPVTNHLVSVMFTDCPVNYSQMMMGQNLPFIPRFVSNNNIISCADPYGLGNSMIFFTTQQQLQQRQLHLQQLQLKQQQQLLWLQQQQQQQQQQQATLSTIPAIMPGVNAANNTQNNVQKNRLNK